MNKNILISVLACALANGYGSPLVPVPRPDQWWLDQHAGYVENTKDSNGSIPIIFYGASIVDFWDSDGKEVWDEKYAPLGAVNYGISGDKIEHVLWRILNGEIEGLSPKLIMIQIGGNNLSAQDSDELIVEGIANLLRILREMLPTTKILFIGIPPRREIGEHDTFAHVSNINIKTAKLDDGNSVRFLNMFDQFSVTWRNVDPELFKDDKLHLVLEGYRKWDRTMSSLFHRMLQ